MLKGSLRGIPFAVVLPVLSVPGTMVGIQGDLGFEFVAVFSQCTLPAQYMKHVSISGSEFAAQHLAYIAATLAWML